jgi:hypothetical protein
VLQVQEIGEESSFMPGFGLVRLYAGAAGFPVETCPRFEILKFSYIFANYF